MTLNNDNTPIAPPSDTWQALQQQLAEQPNTPRAIPPLERWQPNLCGNMDLQVKANGEWWHEGAKVTRQSLVSLFAKVLWAEVDDQGEVSYYLKTPVEKLGIGVEDAPLLVTQVDQVQADGKTWLQFVTSQGDVVRADTEHPIQLGLPFYQSKPYAVTSARQAEQPYLLVRKNGNSTLYGLIHRNVFYHLINLGTLEQTGEQVSLVLTSGDTKFRLSMPMA